MSDNAFDMMGPAPSAGDEAAEQATPIEQKRRKGSYRSQIARSNLIMAGLFVAAGVGVYLFSRGHAPAEASAEQKLLEATVDSAILHLAQPVAGASDTPSQGRVTEALLKNFSEQITSVQVPLERLGKNPFVFVPAKPHMTVRPSGPDQNAPEASKTPEEVTQEQAMARLSKLRLQSIMRGSGKSVAIISSNLLSEGQQIEGFTVKAIRSQSVVLTWQGKEFVLEMDSMGG